jgi:hypothetical protein
MGFVGILDLRTPPSCVSQQFFSGGVYELIGRWTSNRHLLLGFTVETSLRCVISRLQPLDDLAPCRCVTQIGVNRLIRYTLRARDNHRVSRKVGFFWKCDVECGGGPRHARARLHAYLVHTEKSRRFNWLGSWFNWLGSVPASEGLFYVFCLWTY